MNIDQLKNALPDYAKDIKLNLSSILTEEGSPQLNRKEILSITLASAYASGNKDVIAAFTEKDTFTLEELNGIKAAATIMAMNNIYYRFTHSMEDASYNSMPAKLRMNIMANPGIDKILFELCSLAVSAINGCTKCMNAHSAQLEKNGITKETIQSAVRIASVVHALTRAYEIRD